MCLFTVNLSTLNVRHDRRHHSASIILLVFSFIHFIRVYDLLVCRLFALIERKLVTLIDFNWFTQIQFISKIAMRNQYAAATTQPNRSNKSVFSPKFNTINICCFRLVRLFIRSMTSRDAIIVVVHLIYLNLIWIYFCCFFFFLFFRYCKFLYLQISSASANLCESSPWSHWTCNQLVLLHPSAMVLCGTKTNVSRFTVARSELVA